MRPHRILLSLTLGIGVALVAAACTGNGEKVDPRCELAVTRYQGVATDETCMVILDEEDRGNVQLGGANAAVFVVPTNGTAFSSTATTITFTWTSLIDANGDALFAPLPHEAPVTGAVHMLRVKGGAEPEIFFTTRLHFDLPVAELGTGSRTVEITSVYLTENRILNPTIDGPFRPTADTSFSIVP